MWNKEFIKILTQSDRLTADVGRRYKSTIGLAERRLMVSVSKLTIALRFGVKKSHQLGLHY